MYAIRSYYEAVRLRDGENRGIARWPGWEIVRLEFPPGQGMRNIEGYDTLPGVDNFYLGNDRARWASGLRTFRGIIYYDAVDELSLAIGIQPGINGERAFDVRYTSGDSHECTLSATTPGARSRYVQATELSSYLAIIGSGTGDIVVDAAGEGDEVAMTGMTTSAAFPVFHACVITSYSIHYTKLYDSFRFFRFLS